MSFESVDDQSQRLIEDDYYDVSKVNSNDGSNNGSNNVDKDGDNNVDKNGNSNNGNANNSNTNVNNNVDKNVDKNKMSEMIKKAIKSVTTYNSELNQCRKDERKFSIDLQTYSVHYPIGLGKDNKMLQKNVATGKCLKVGKYPVATIHGQYQDWYIKYSPEELKYFPINTVLYGPIISAKPKTDGEGECSSASDSVSDSDSGSGSDSESSSSN